MPVQTAELPGPRITVIGGGSGTAAIYPAIAEWTVNATAIVAVSDSGGSTGEIVNQLGGLPLGDIRHVMTASSTHSVIRGLANYRFGGQGSLEGHHPLNFFVTACCLHSKDPAKGIRQAGEVLGVPGCILPVTLRPHRLVMQDGEDRIFDEHRIDTHTPRHSAPRISHDPPAEINPEAAQVIAKSDMVVFAPGSLYTSKLAALCVSGMPDALRATAAPKVLLANGAAEKWQREPQHVADEVRVLTRHGIPVDIVLYPTPCPADQRYEAADERPVDCSEEGFQDLTVRAVGAALMGDVLSQQSPNDSVDRSRLRHDGAAVVRALQAMLDRQPSAAKCVSAELGCQTCTECAQIALPVCP